MEISNKLEEKIRDVFENFYMEDEDDAVNELRFAIDNEDLFEFDEDELDAIAEMDDEDIRQLFRDWSEETGHAAEKEMDDVVTPDTLHALESEIADCPEKGCHISKESAEAVKRIISAWREKILTQEY